MELTTYRDEEEDFKLFCLEGVEDVEEENDSQIITFLEYLALNFDIINVYKTCDDIETFEISLSNLLYHDRFFKDYSIIYLVFEGDDNLVKIGDYYYTLEEIAEFLKEN